MRALQKLAPFAIREEGVRQAEQAPIFRTAATSCLLWGVYRRLLRVRGRTSLFRVGIEVMEDEAGGDMLDILWLPGDTDPMGMFYLKKRIWTSAPTQWKD